MGLEVLLRLFPHLAPPLRAKATRREAQRIFLQSKLVQAQNYQEWAQRQIREHWFFWKKHHKDGDHAKKIRGSLVAAEMRQSVAPALLDLVAEKGGAGGGGAAATSNAERERIIRLEQDVRELKSMTAKVLEVVQRNERC